MDDWVQAVRTAAGERVWGAAVKLARDGGVDGRSDDGEEVHLKVRAPGRSVWQDVYLWPEEPDWGCDCGLPGASGPDQACVHVAAAAIALDQARKRGDAALPAPSITQRVRVRYALTSRGDGLEPKRIAVRPDGSMEVLNRPLAALDLVAGRADVQAESVLALHPGGEIVPETLRRLLAVLEADSDVTLDDQPVKIAGDPVLFRVRVTDDGEGFKLALVRPTGIDRLFRGAALVGTTLHPTSHGDLTQEQRRMLVKGVTYGPDEVGTLVGEVLPKMRERIPVDVQTDRLPKADALVPRVLVELKEKPGGLEIQSSLVYGDPPVARVTAAGTLAVLTDAVVPARDPGAERIVSREYFEKTGLTVGFTRLLPPSEAAQFLQARLPGHDGPVRGRVDPKRFEIRDVALRPKIDLRDDGGAWALAVAFGDDGEAADPQTVLEAWRSGKTLVPLLDGGYAPLPANWLAEHGALLQELLEARDAKGRVQRNSTAALIELLEDTAAEVPPDLARLRSFLEGGEGLPDAVIPQGLRADLRPYQRAGLQWLSFLRQMDLHGVLADDMGLGKTVQALAAMLDVGGKHLVVAPTSVLTNWQREAARFAPGMRVVLFHGPERQLDPAAELTLTSYALLRMDIDRLRDQDWTYVVLDEAQAIKNPHSLTARSAYVIKARHRLVLTGTPVENRLEELWSLFRYLMPGLLGSEGAFRDRFSRPIELGDDKARAALRNRVRPYVLRRLKQQVETELPPLTEIVERIPLESKQRGVYDTVRLAARRDVQELLAKGGQATMQVLEALLRMRQACCDPSLLPGEVGKDAGAAKLDRMEEILVEVVSEGHKVLVFSQWTTLLDRVETRLAALGIDWTRLDGSTRDRQAVIDRFQSDDGPPVFLLSLKAGGFGLNLTAADYVIHLDPWWNPAVERQATDRAHRIGQDKPVVSYKLVAEATVEERILELQAAKRDLADAALGTEGGFLRTLNAQELRSLFEAESSPSRAVPSPA
jgi:superfamily II DNA or RNA helicase